MTPSCLKLLRGADHKAPANHSQAICQSLPAPEGSHLEDARNFRVITSKPRDRPESVIMMAVLVTMYLMLICRASRAYLTQPLGRIMLSRSGVKSPFPSRRPNVVTLWVDSLIQHTFRGTVPQGWAKAKTLSVA